jgi:putative thiamine transport system substrate-binding protein
LPRNKGEDDDGAIDMIWINGSNFAAMKDADLLFGPLCRTTAELGCRGCWWAKQFKLITVPQGANRLGLARRSNAQNTASTGARTLLEWVKVNLVCSLHPQPPDFLGTTFPKQALVDIPRSGAANPEARKRNVYRLLWACRVGPHLMIPAYPNRQCLC